MPAAIEERVVEDVAERGLNESARRPPMLPGGSPVRGHLRELAADNLALFERCAAVHGIAQFRVYWYRCHVITDPALAGALLIQRASAFKKTRGLQIARPTFGNGLVTSEGEQRQRQQALFSPLFTPRAVARYADCFAETISAELDRWQGRETIDLHEAMVDVSLEVVCRALFGWEAGRLKPMIRSAAHAVEEWHGEAQALCLPYPHYLPTVSNLRYRARTHALNRAVRRSIRSARKGERADDGLLGLMLRVQDDGRAIDDREIRDQIVTLFLAGHDTTASSMAFALYELAYRPDLQDRIASELRASGASECLELVLKEALRLYPAVHLVARTATRDVMLGEYLIRRGEEVVLPLYVLQRNARLFERPHEFVPERWLESAPACPRHAHLPFSTGPRVCIGQAMAMAELRSIVGAVLLRVRLEPAAPREPRIANRMTLGPAPSSTRVRLNARES